MEQHVRDQEAIPLDPFCMSVVSCRISTPSKIYFMNYKKNIYPFRKKKLKAIEVYKVENGSTLLSLHLFAFFTYDHHYFCCLRCTWCSYYPSIYMLLFFSIILYDKFLKGELLGQILILC